MRDRSLSIVDNSIFGFYLNFFGFASKGGLAGALGTTVGSILAQQAQLGGLPGLFALSSAIRAIALLPLIFVREPHSQTLPEILDKLLQFGVDRRLNCDP